LSSEPSIPPVSQAHTTWNQLQKVINMLTTDSELLSNQTSLKGSILSTTSKRRKATALRWLVLYSDLGLDHSNICCQHISFRRFTHLFTGSHFWPQEPL
jgi:hypothetical protein